MLRTRVSACLVVVASSLAGCRGTRAVEYPGEVRVTSPALVTISPGLQVVADADEPLFHAGGYYWLYRDASWYRSDSYRAGFTPIDRTYVPAPLRAIERPRMYVQYRRHMKNEWFAREQRAPARPEPKVAQQPPVPPHRPTPTERADELEATPIERANPTPPASAVERSHDKRDK